jgi:uncharacterized protein (DUF1501 family)
MLIKRRNFLKNSTMAAAGTFMVPKFLQALGNGQYIDARGRKIVVIIQLSGGNDGLNTVIPIQNDIYYRSRPRIAIKKEEALRLNNETGLNPQLTFFKELFDNGELAILNGVGYPNPDRSHFRSMDIWHTASDSHTYLQTGWLGRYLDAQCTGCPNPTQILELDDLLSLALKGENFNGIACKNPRQLFATGNQGYLQKIVDHYHDHEPVADYLYKTLTDTLNSADYIFKESIRRPSKVAYPNSELGKNLQTIASLAFSEINTRVYYVSLGSFDTHINQAAQQKRLFTELNDAVGAFVKDIKSNGRFKDLLLFTFSEFGRRVTQNASGGTDHGTANNMFFISGSLKQKGLVNPPPDLSELENNDLKFSVDFRQVYQMVLNDWLDVKAEAILGGNFAPLQIV